MPPPLSKTPPRYSLRPAAPPDETFRLRLYADTRAQEMARSGWSAIQVEDFVREQFHARQRDYAARFPGAETFIIVVEAIDAGAVILWRSATELRVVGMELLPAFRRQGIGSALLRGWIEEAGVNKLPLTLSVREDNPAAARLYRRLGFKNHARADGYLAMRRGP